MLASLSTKPMVASCSSWEAYLCSGGWFWNSQKGPHITEAEYSTHREPSVEMSSHTFWSNQLQESPLQTNSSQLKFSWDTKPLTPLRYSSPTRHKAHFKLTPLTTPQPPPKKNKLTICPPTIKPISCNIILLNTPASPTPTPFLLQKHLEIKLTICPPTIMPISCDIILLNACFTNPPTLSKTSLKSNLQSAPQPSCPLVVTSYCWTHLLHQSTHPVKNQPEIKLTICPPTIMPISCDIILLKASWLPICGARVGFPGVPVPPVDAVDDVAVVVVDVALVGLDPGAAVVVVVVASPPGEAAVVEEGGVLVVLAPGCTGIPCMPARLGKGNMTSHHHWTIISAFFTSLSGLVFVRLLKSKCVCVCMHSCVRACACMSVLCLFVNAHVCFTLWVCRCMRESVCMCGMCTHVSRQ